MGRSLAPETMARIEQLLAEGTSYHGVARVLGVARRTVSRIANQMGMITPGPSDVVTTETVHPPIRCKCGLLLTTLPCLRCMIAHQALVVPTPPCAPTQPVS